MDYEMIPDFINVCEDVLRSNAPRMTTSERLYNADWRANRRREIVSMHAGRRSRRVRQATPPWADLAAIAEVYAERWRLNHATGIKHHVDHIIPLKGKLACGLHVAANLQIIPAGDNLRKRNKFDNCLGNWT